MNFEILNADLAHLDETKEISLRPSFRKATRNMILATAVLEKTLKPLQKFFSQNQSQFSLVLTSESGELETTFDFLKTLHKDKLARPMLFQNSLHNATAGFLSIQFALTAPVITSSSTPFSTENALEIAGLLLSQEQCQYCLVLSVDVWPSLKGYEKPFDDLVDGAACVILCRPQAVPESVQPLAQLSALEILSTQNPHSLPVEKFDATLWQPPPLSQNLLYQLASQLKTQKQGSLQIDRGHFGTSLAKWQQANL